MKKTFGKTIILSIVAITMTAALCFAAYMGHKEEDSMTLIKAHPELKGSALDGCGTCHRGGAVRDKSTGKISRVNSCDYCHAVVLHGGGIAADTLNFFGRDYLAAGRNEKAFADISAKDSDADGFSNFDELKALTLPGDPDSSPDSRPAPSGFLSLDDLRSKKLAEFTQTIFMNVTKSKEGDSYATYKGFLLSDVLKAAGAADNATSIDVISIDGFEVTFTMDQISKTYKQGAPVLGLGKDKLGDCGWVRYEAPALAEGVPLPDANVLLVFETNGKPNEPGMLDPSTGKLSGTGPFRTIAPQMRAPSPPDLSRMADAACNDKVPQIYHFNEDYEKNSDYCVKAVAAIRVNPMPAGTVDYNWRRDGGDFFTKGKIVVFGDLK